jgi:hypothetical protein
MKELIHEWTERAELARLSVPEHVRYAHDCGGALLTAISEENLRALAEQWLDDLYEAAGKKRPRGVKP